ncbi:hypothetical protein [Streptomyces stelliscabiei]|uniref:hypothetical protein n=1 Tax=Streptomyces stelliscabiei TaxID=146820 RepID=UPI0029A76207|nr:hypothetical protein [Streptomyces stelliscabiei]MDX2553644.1 hypothetical protein [Streptomyces stelliscabiei]MDX2613380.1 hypothetical protein [Streptomyces stelliscabiei]MDX2641387.1 hypothetical protein [Streptomyces stelliscabiei]MDX2664428.1 hypothetical protein [Streptomyces stelliscabiei]MDX2713463.1 hypothetical protein [Streptomyces stelliscabiei]
MVEQNQPYSVILLKFFVLVGLLSTPALVFHWGAWLPFAGAGVYLLWEVRRLHSAFDELAHLWNEQNERNERNQREQRHGRQHQHPQEQEQEQEQEPATRES